MGRLRRGVGTVERAAATSVRRASLTDSDVGKSFESSGSRSTMLALAGARWRYLPLTPPLSFERSYSARRSSEERLRAFCVAMCFPLRGPTGTDDANLCGDICVGDDEDAAAS